MAPRPEIQTIREILMKTRQEKEADRRYDGTMRGRASLDKDPH
jgi:hypothetical protein